MRGERVRRGGECESVRGNVREQSNVRGGV